MYVLAHRHAIRPLNLLTECTALFTAQRVLHHAAALRDEDTSLITGKQHEDCNPNSVDGNEFATILSRRMGTISLIGKPTIC